MPGITDRDTFAAAALTGLLAGRKFTALDDAIVAEAYAEAAYGIADAMLRERAKTNLDAALEATAGTPGTGDTQEIAAYRRFVGEVMNWISEATGFLHDDVLRTDDARDFIHNACMRCWDAFDRIASPTDHGAAPAARASVGRPRTDNADLPTCAGTGDTPDSPQPIACSVFDRSQPIAKPTPVHTPPAHATPSVGSVPRDGTEPVAWGVANGSRVLATSISRMDAVDMQGDYAYHTAIVPLYRSPTLTDAEREDLECAASRLQSDPNGPRDLQVADTLRGLLERLGGGR